VYLLACKFFFWVNCEVVAFVVIKKVDKAFRTKEQFSGFFKHYVSRVIFSYFLFAIHVFMVCFVFVFMFSFMFHVFLDIRFVLFLRPSREFEL